VVEEVGEVLAADLDPVLVPSPPLSAERFSGQHGLVVRLSLSLVQTEASIRVQNAS
jgi:hypothetical protein